MTVAGPAMSLASRCGLATLTPRSRTICAAHLVTSFVAHAYGKSENRVARCCDPAAPRLNDRRLGPNDLNPDGGRAAISTVSLSLFQPTAGISRRCAAAGLSRPTAGISRRRAAAGLSEPRVWRAGRSAAASARGNSAAAWCRYGLAARVLELEETWLGLGVR